MENRLLLVDDEEQILKALKRTFMNEDYVIDIALSGEAALEMVGKRPYKVVISDERMPGMSGSDLLAMVSLRCPEVVKILLTGHASVESAMKAVNQGEISRFMLKPWDNFELRLAVSSAIEKYDLEMQNRKLMALLRTGVAKLRAGNHLDKPTVDLLDSLTGRDEIQPQNRQKVMDLLDQCLKII